MSHRWIEDTLSDNLIIRDTIAHNSESTEGKELPAKTLIINNGLDQTVSLQMQGSRDNVNWFNVGSTFDIPANSWAWQSCEVYFPFGRVIAQCATAPTAGGLSLWCEKLG